MKLRQNQVWKQGNQFIRIVELQRLKVKYKAMKDLSTKEGDQHDVTKKEFCRMLKGATLVSPPEIGNVRDQCPPPESDSDHAAPTTL